MPKFLAGCHYNEEEISRHLKLKYRILAGPNEWQQVCSRSNPEKTGRSCEEADFSWLSSKVSRTLLRELLHAVRCFWRQKYSSRVADTVCLLASGDEAKLSGERRLNSRLLTPFFLCVLLFSPITLDRLQGFFAERLVVMKYFP